LVPLILDGNRVRDQIKAECRPRVERIIAHAGRAPGLAVILAGNNPASEVYVRNKTKTAGELGIANETITPPASVTTGELLALVEELNRRPEIDGILVQLPLPSQVDSQRILLAVAPEKDVDGFHPYNVGLLATGREGLKPCTPAGIIQLLKRFEIPIAGRNAVVVGRSDIVGKPMALLLLQENATVTICHSRTRDLAAVCRRADILIVAIGRARLITTGFVKPGAAVIDVGNTYLDGKVVGDVDFAAVAPIAGHLSPVPGGVGPLTITMLLRNTVTAARLFGESQSLTTETRRHGDPTEGNRR
jgi:methylenetetrahydrofolate dehydrogenase (NADP+) / methenyltetrahydrofolate cyclohydrolase